MGEKRRRTPDTRRDGHLTEHEAKQMEA